MTDVMLC